MTEQPRIAWDSKPDEWQLFFAGEGPLSARPPIHYVIPDTNLLLEVGARQLTELEILAHLTSEEVVASADNRIFRQVSVIRTSACDTDTDNGKPSHWAGFLHLMGVSHDRGAKIGRAFNQPRPPSSFILPNQIRIYEVWATLRTEMWLAPAHPVWYLDAGLRYDSPLLHRPS